MGAKSATVGGDAAFSALCADVEIVNLGANLKIVELGSRQCPACRYKGKVQKRSEMNQHVMSKNARYAAESSRPREAGADELVLIDQTLVIHA